jgi:4-amino-4-deoxy-L-arabinose transferase-like glycosyltransferase
MNRRVFSDHRAILAILGAFIALALAFSFTTPLFEAPDEQWHYAFVQYVAQGRGLPLQTRNPEHLARQEASQPPLYYLLAAAATFWIDTSDFPAIIWENPHYGYDVPGVVNDNKNLFIHTAAESLPYRGAVLAIHLARIVSVFLGTVSVFCAYLLALEIARERKWLAASAAGFMAFVPQFIFVSGAVSNDSVIVAMSALSLWLTLRLFFIQPRLRDTIALGAAAGLAALAKVSGLGIAVLALFVIAWIQRNNARAFVIHGLLFVVCVLLVAGWWYARNWVLYGELTGTEMMLTVFGERGAFLTIQQLATQLVEVWETFWIGFGWGNIRAPSIVYVLCAILLTLSVIGWLFTFVHSIITRGKDASILPGNRITLLVPAVWIILTFTALLRWMEVTQAPHGRLFFPVLPALALLMIVGLIQLVPPRSQAIAAFVPPIAMFAISLYAFVFILRPAYAFPPSLNVADVEKIANRVDIVYEGKIKLLGYEILPKRALPEGSVELTLYWQALVQMDEDYSIGIALLDANRRVLAQRNSYPGHGMLPTRLLRPGQIIRDAYWVPVPSSAPAPGLAQVQVSLFRREDKHDLVAFDPNGNAVTPIIGRFKVASAHPIEAHPQNRTDYVFGNQVALIGYDVRAQGFELICTGSRSLD